MRAWHWLSDVMTAASASSVSDLNEKKSRRPLASGIPPGRLNSVAQDGYDPGMITVTRTESLLDRVAAKKKYRKTLAGYRHPLWRYLMNRDIPSKDLEAWLAPRISQHGIVDITSADLAFALDLGLISSHWEDHHYEWLHLDGKRFATLDGILILLGLLREAQNQNHLSRIRSLRETLLVATSMFAKAQRYHREALDTWEYLVRTRIITWNPTFQPRGEDLAKAKHQLLELYANSEKPEGKRGPASPERLTRGRSERRFRRQVWMLAASSAIVIKHELVDRRYQNADPVFGWIVANRELISAHMSRAYTLLVMDEHEFDQEPLPPLAMPRTLFNLRQRPENTNDWHKQQAYGGRLMFDFIPVIVSDS